MILDIVRNIMISQLSDVIIGFIQFTSAVNYRRIPNEQKSYYYDDRLNIKFDCAV